MATELKRVPMTQTGGRQVQVLAMKLRLDHWDW
jgi:hypothetical protein